MKTALLVCDHVLYDLAPIHGTYPDMYKKMLHDLELDPFFVCDGEFPNTGEFEAFICTGSRFSVYENIDWIDQLKSMVCDINSFDKKFVGVCFGHQILAEALGGKVEKAEDGFLIGVHPFEVVSQTTWMQPYADTYNVLMLCQDQVVKLPENSQLLSQNKDCPVGMFQINSCLGIQGHPEFTNAYDQAVFEKRRSIIGDEKISQAIGSFQTPHDAEMLAGWIRRFLLNT